MLNELALLLYLKVSFVLYSPHLKDDFREMLKDQTQKNGFAFAAMYFKGMNNSLLKIKEKSKNLISLIDSELEK